MNITRRALWFAGISAVCAMFLVTPGRAHAADPNATYAGTMSDGGAITLTVSADGKAVAISLRYAPSSVPAGCSAGQTGTPPLASNGSQFGMNNSDAAGGTRAFFSGPDYQSVAGVTTVIPSGGTNCPARYLTWRADRVPATGISGKPAASFTYSGSVSAIGVSETVGTAQITTDANGGISRFVLSATNAGCQYSLGTDAVPVTNGSGDQSGTGGRLSLVVGQVSGSTRVSFGGGFIATGTGSCPTLGGYWVATRIRRSADSHESDDSE